MIKSGSTKMKCQKNDSHNMVWIGLNSPLLGWVLLVLGGSKQPTRLVETDGYVTHGYPSWYPTSGL